MKKQNKNFLYNILYQIFIFLIPLITTPYISRVLGVENVGIYSFTYSIVYYFMLFSMLGITNYGSREIAKCKTKEETSKTFKSIYALQLALNIFSIVVYITYALLSNYEHKDILLIQSLMLISTGLDINWFFFGKEKFKLTVTRNTIIKLLSLALIFLFVKESNDLPIYTGIIASTTLLSQACLWFFLKKEIVRVKITAKEIHKHIKPCLILFIPVIAYSIYRVMDKTMIGGMISETELGYYESAEKIINIPISFIAALGTVMLPHSSSQTKDAIKKNIYSTFSLISFIIIPMTAALILIGNDLSVVYFGDSFIKTGNIIRILSITSVFAAIANVIRTNYLIPLSQDKIYIRSTLLGAAFNLILNLFFIPLYGAYGACIGTIAAEFIVMLYQVVKTRKDIHVKNIIKSALPHIVKTIIAISVMFISGLFIEQLLIKIIVEVLVAVIIYLLLEFKYIKTDFFGK